MLDLVDSIELLDKEKPNWVENMNEIKNTKKKVISRFHKKEYEVEDNEDMLVEEENMNRNEKKGRKESLSFQNSDVHNDSI